MPGIVVFRRRWSVGSDDLVVPGAFLFTVHLIWTIILAVLLRLVTFDIQIHCVLLLWALVLGYVIILAVSMITEFCICVVAMRGSILDTSQRSSMQHFLYFRVAVMFIEGGWLIAGIAWFVQYYLECPSIDKAKGTVLGMVVCNLCILLSVLITVWCTYDAAGRSWVKMKQYQRSMRESESKFQYKRSGSTRNWRQRKVIRAYEDSWQQRCRFLFCCSTPSDRNRNSFADIARLLSDFFRDLDVVPSDVIAGLVLLRKFQKIERKAIVERRKNATYEFLSGVAVTPRTQFLSLHENGDLELFQTVIHYAHYAVRAYGWPIYVMTSTLGACSLCTNLRCCCRHGTGSRDDVEIVGDNCCRCNYAALQKLREIGDIEIVYVTYHVDVGETPFFVALDYDRKKVVISIRGTLSMKDILTDLNAEGETLPLHPPRDDWLGHKGMVQAAQYIFNKIQEENLIERALQKDLEKGTDSFDLVIVGHSLGAGTASILGILLRQSYSSLLCYCYSPPGGLLSMPAVEYTKSFTISVVVGKDVVPRIGLNQMEALRADLINAIKRSVDPKWKTITCSIVCCGCSQPTSAVELSSGESDVGEYMRAKQNARCVGIHPSDSTIALTSHQPLYPPGKIIHVVRHHPTRGEQALSKNEPVYQALWAENTDFDEVLISPVMIQDHMPDKVLDALNKVVTTLGPRKPQRSGSNPFPRHFEDLGGESPVYPQRIYLETSFTSLQSPTGLPGSNASSVTNGYYSASSNHQPSPLPPTFSLVRMRQTDTSRPTPAETQSLGAVSRVDLIYDDWFGLAPLASPESLSEVSSISSRTSLLVVSQPATICEVTPKILRRTPKIIGSLSTCADDVRNVKNFRMAKKFRRTSGCDEDVSPNVTENSSNSNLSYESATSGFNNNNNNNVAVVGSCGDGERSDDFQSAEDILDTVLASAGCKDFFNDNTGFLETHFDLVEEIQSPSQEIDPDIMANMAMDLNLDEEHRSLQYYQRESTSSKPNSVDSGSVCRTPSDTTKNVTFNPYIVNIDTGPSLECSPVPQRHHHHHRWQIFNRGRQKQPKASSSTATTTSTTTTTTTTPQTTRVIVENPPAPKTILCTNRKRNASQASSSSTMDEFSLNLSGRTEASPLLLTGLVGVTNSNSSNSGGNGGSGERTSPNFVQRKKLVFPAEMSLAANVITGNKSGESSV